MSSSKINYNNPLPEYEGLRFYVDAFNERRRIEQIMPIFYEEQPITWMLYKKELTEFMNRRNGNARILDVGCGSGFWGLLLKKKFPWAEVIGIDKNPLAIERTRYNSLLNNLNINLVEGLYDRKWFEPESFDLIVLTPPYHLYDPINTEKIPYFARGGDYGLKEFYSQSSIAFSHLKNDGKILFNQMSAGNEIPDYLLYYKRTFGIGSLEYTNILPPIETISFLQGLYGHLDSNYLKNFAIKMPRLFYTSGVYSKNNVSFNSIDNTSQKETVLLQLKETWQTRIDLHKEINNF